MDSLTIAQEKAINHFEGPALVVAGPGAGKTFVITERVKKLIENHSINPENILVTTFTDKAATELKIKLAKTIGRKAELIQISTIHSFCKTMLEKYFLTHSYGSTIDVLDEEGKKLFIEFNKIELGLAKWEDGHLVYIKNSFNFFGEVNKFYDKMSENRISVDDLKKELKKDTLEEADEKIIDSYKKYCELLEKEKKMDFAALQIKFFDLINENNGVLKNIQNQFKFILVDEYQDTSPLQDKLFRIIAKTNGNIFVVGDQNQSIYGFRGASLKNFLRFSKNYPKTKEYLLDVNFRSTKNIVDISNKIFETKVKNLFKSKRRSGEKVKILHAETADDVARKTVDLIKTLKNDKIIKNYGDVSLLFRSLKNHSKEYIKYLNKGKIPYVSFGEGSFLERSEVRSTVYLMSYVTQELYVQNSFEKWRDWWKKDIFLTDFFNFSNSTKTTIQNAEFNLFDLRDDEDFKKVGFVEKRDIKKLKKLNKLKYDVQREKEQFGDMVRGKNSLLIIFYKILDYSGYFERILLDNSKENKEILKNLGRLSEIITRYMEVSKQDDIRGFLWYVYNSEGGVDQCKIEDENTVKLMTVHKSKGLEFPVVFLCSLNEGRFPLCYRCHQFIQIPEKFLDKEELENEKEEFFEEEKRLFYVGLTRAQDNLVFTFSDKILVQRTKMSRFLELIPQEFITNDSFKISTEKNYKVDKTVPTLNYSAINTYIDCPLRYTLIYDYTFVTPPSYMQKLGIFIHNSVQSINEILKKKTQIPPKEMKKMLEKYWLDLPTSRKKNDDLREKQINELIQYYLYAKEHYRKIIAIEEPFSHIDDNMIIKGKVDLIAEEKDGKIALIDFKTRKKEGIEKTNVDKQLQIYNYCLESKYKIDKLVALTFQDRRETEFKYNHEETHNFLKKMSKEMAEEDFKKKKMTFVNNVNLNFIVGVIKNENLL